MKYVQHRFKFLSLALILIILSSLQVTYAQVGTENNVAVTLNSSMLTASSYAEPFGLNNGFYLAAPNGTPPTNNIPYYLWPGGAAENISTNMTSVLDGTAPSGAGVWQPATLPANDGKLEILIHPQEIFGNGTYQLNDINSISWFTNKPTAQTDPDWYINIWLDAGSGNVAFLSGEPYWSGNLAAPANTWNQWVADTTPGGTNEIRFHEPGFACTTFGWASPTMPSLDQLVAGAWTWNSVPSQTFISGCAGTPNPLTTSIDYSTMDILGISIGIGNPWAGAFTGMVDNLVINLDNPAGGAVSDVLTVDFETAAPTNNPTIDKSFSPTTIFVGNTSTLTFQVNNANNSPLGALNFTDNLPAGTEVAATPNIVNTCSGVVTALPGSGSISLTGGIVPSAGCTISVDVTATTSGTFTNTTGSISTTSINFPASSGTDNATANITADPLPTSQVIVVSPANAQGWIVDNPVYCTPATQPGSAPYDPCSVTGGGTPINGQFELGTDTEAGLGFENGPDTPPLGTGSYFAEIYDGGSKVVVVRNDYNNVSFAGIYGMSISTYLDPSATDNSNWYINLYADSDGNGTYDCRLDGSIPSQAAGSWQTTDLMAITWNITCAANGTLAAFSAAHPNAQLINGFNEAGFPQIIINQGDTQTNYEGYIGNFDAFRIAHTTVGDITWDFELENPVVPVDPTPEPGNPGSGTTDTGFDLSSITELPATGQTPWWAQMAQGLFIHSK